MIPQIETKSGITHGDKTVKKISRTKDGFPKMKNVSSRALKINDARYKISKIDEKEHKLNKNRFFMYKTNLKSQAFFLVGLYQKKPIPYFEFYHL